MQCFAVSTAYAYDWNATARIVPQIQQVNNDSLLPSTIDRDYQRNGRAELELRAHIKPVVFVGTARSQYVDDAKPQYESVLNELYSDFALGSEQFTLGKKIMSWDVGYAYRPLDVLQRDDRRALYQSAYVGVPLLAWEKFTERYAFTAVYANPGAGMSTTSKDDESLALRMYRRDEGWDAYLIARASERNGLEIGPAWSWTMTDAIEMHGSLAYQRRQRQLMIDSSPTAEKTQATARKALLGFTWAHSAGWSAILEAWYDGTAASDQQWRDATAATQWSPSRHVAYAALGSYLSQPNLRRENALLRISRTGGNWEISADALYTLEDGGLAVTSSFDYKWDWQRLSGGVRYFGGRSDAVYRQLPSDATAFLAWQASW